MALLAQRGEIKRLIHNELDIEDGATKNSPDATLLARANHTGTQAASTISDFSTAADARIAAAVIDALLDVTITAPAPGEVLKYNGSIWENDTIAGGPGGAVDSVFARTGDVVADAADYAAHYSPLAHTHTASQVTDFSAAADARPLSSHAAATGSVDFGGQQALSFRIENRTSDPGAPVAGQIWLRTDL